MDRDVPPSLFFFSSSPLSLRHSARSEMSKSVAVDLLPSSSLFLGISDRNEQERLLRGWGPPLSPFFFFFFFSPLPLPVPVQADKGRDNLMTKIQLLVRSPEPPLPPLSFSFFLSFRPYGVGKMVIRGCPPRIACRENFSTPPLLFPSGSNLILDHPLLFLLFFFFFFLITLDAYGRDDSFAVVVVILALILRLRPLPLSPSPPFPSFSLLIGFCRVTRENWRNLQKDIRLCKQALFVFRLPVPSFPFPLLFPPPLRKRRRSHRRPFETEKILCPVFQTTPAGFLPFSSFSFFFLLVPSGDIAQKFGYLMGKAKREIVEDEVSWPKSSRADEWFSPLPPPFFLFLFVAADRYQDVLAKEPKKDASSVRPPLFLPSSPFFFFFPLMVAYKDGEGHEDECKGLRPRHGQTTSFPLSFFFCFFLFLLAGRHSKRPQKQFKRLTKIVGLHPLGMARRASLFSLSSLPLPSLFFSFPSCQQMRPRADLGGEIVIEEIFLFFTGSGLQGLAILLSSPFSFPPPLILFATYFAHRGLRRPHVAGRGAARGFSRTDWRRSLFSFLPSLFFPLPPLPFFLTAGLG